MTKHEFAAQPRLCAGDPTQLAIAAARATGRLRRRTEHFLWVARHQEQFPAYQIERLGIVPEGVVRPLARPNESAYCFLAYLLTDDEDFAVQGKRKLMQLADSVAVREQGDWTQMHNWCDAFPFVRWLLLYDWMWDSPVFTAQDHVRLQERFLYYLWAHPYQRLLARPIVGTPGNNQNAAMALACSIGGYLFGVNRGASPRARQLLALGLPHLVKFITAFPRGGYSFEGSNYMAGVNSFLIPFAIDVVEAICGMDVLDLRENADCASPREVLQAIMHLATPGGLTLPWDCAGFARAEFTPAAAYLAFRTGDHGALDFLDSLGELEHPSHMGWGFDKTLWTLLWSLRANGNTKEEARTTWTLNYAEPSTGAGAHGPNQRLFFFQMWDRSHWPPGRAQFNPNSIILTFDGAPLLLDGQCVEVAKAAKFEHPDCRFFRSDIQQNANFGIGTVGAHNTIVFDDEEHFAPRISTEGKLICSQYLPGATLVEADVTDCYRARYDMQSVRRAALVLGDELVLIRDCIVSATPHKVTWRAHSRTGQVQSGPGSFAVTTPEHIRLEICVPNNELIAHVHYPAVQGQVHSGHPVASIVAVNLLEGRCHEVSYYAHGQSLTLYTLLVPTAGLQLWKKLDSHWQWLVVDSPEQVDLTLQYWPGGESIDFSKASWFYTSDHHAPGIGLYRCEFSIANPVPDSMWIELPRLVRSACLRINDREFPITLGSEELPLLSHQIEIGAVIREGVNIVEIIAPSTLESALCGEVRLLVSASEFAPARLVQKGATTLELHYHGRCDVVNWNDRECLIQGSTGQTIRIPVTESTAPMPRSENNTGFTKLQTIVAEIGAISTAFIPLDRVQTLTTLQGNDWRAILDVLERVINTTDAVIIEAVWNLLQREFRTHATLPKRQPDDVSWYRVKAAAARVLGTALFEPATEVLGEMLLSGDMYPARAACAMALGQIATPRALDYLRRVSADDEWNTMTEAKYWLTKQVSPTEDDIPSQSCCRRKVGR